ncbi:MAG: cation diffusion facilitator family transporter [Flavobacterium sp.]|jgi:cation diffusion facilitator family transporter
MSNCCEEAGCEITKLRENQSRILIIILIINALMFLIEFSAGVIASSIALMADSLDMLGDAFVYGFSLYVVTKNDEWKAKAAYAKSLIMFLFGIVVLIQAISRLLHPELPDFEVIGIVGIIALMANSACLFLLTRHKEDDVNMRSVWLCSRNDIIANVAVLLAGLGVYLSASHWPDIIVGFGISILFIKGAISVYADANASMKKFAL